MTWLALFTSPPYQSDASRLLTLAQNCLNCNRIIVLHVPDISTVRWMLVLSCKANCGEEPNVQSGLPVKSGGQSMCQRHGVITTLFKSRCYNKFLNFHMFDHIWLASHDITPISIIKLGKKKLHFTLSQGTTWRNSYFAWFVSAWQ